jgi:hypothetical protein
MLRWLFLLCLSAIVLSGCASFRLDLTDPTLLVKGTDARNVPADVDVTTSCNVTQPIQDQPPDDPNADPFGYGDWYINADRSIWTMLQPGRSWQVGGEKVLWIRPAGTELTVEGQRLDAEAPPLRAEIPCCYPTGFQTSGLYFPTEGCWEVIATAGDHELRFITQVQPALRGINSSSPLAESVLLQHCGSTACELRPIDPATGKMVVGFEPLELGSYATYGPSNHHTHLAVIAYPSNYAVRDGVLKFVDLATWDTFTTTLTFNDANLTPIFSPDNATLAVVTFDTSGAGAVVHLVDVATGKLLTKQQIDFNPSQAQFTPDGSGLMLFGADSGELKNWMNQQSHVALLDATSLETIWQQPIDGLLNGQYNEDGSNTDPHQAIWWQPAAVFAPGKATLYIVHADQEQLTTIDFRAEQMTTSAITPKLTWMEQLLMLTATPAHAKMLNGTTKEAALSADGRRLYVTGAHYSFENEQLSETSLGVQVIDLETGQEITYIDSNARSVSVEANGSRLFLHGWEQQSDRPYMHEWTDVVDATTYQPITTLEGRAIAVTQRLDCQPILLSTATLENGQTELAILDPETFTILSSSAEWYGGYAGWFVMR